MNRAINASFQCKVLIIAHSELIFKSILHSELLFQTGNIVRRKKFKLI